MRALVLAVAAFAGQRIATIVTGSNVSLRQLRGWSEP
jgi:hypothetical protein